MNSDSNPGTPPGYRMIHIMARHDRRIAMAVALLLVLAGVYGFVRSGCPEFVIAGMALAGAGYFFIRLVGDMVRVIAETLLPR